MSQPLEIGENSCSIISRMACLNSNEAKEYMCGDVCDSSRYIKDVHFLRHLLINVPYCSIPFILVS